MSLFEAIGYVPNLLNSEVELAGTPKRAVKVDKPCTNQDWYIQHVATLLGVTLDQTASDVGNFGANTLPEVDIGAISLPAECPRSGLVGVFGKLACLTCPNISDEIAKFEGN